MNDLERHFNYVIVIAPVCTVYLVYRVLHHVSYPVSYSHSEVVGPNPKIYPLLLIVSLMEPLSICSRTDLHPYLTERQ